MIGSLFQVTVITKSQISPTCIEILSTNNETLHLKLIPWGNEWHKTVSQKDVRENGLIAIGKKNGDGGEHLVNTKDLLAVFSRNTAKDLHASLFTLQ